MLQYSVNKCIFGRRLKLSLPRSGSLKLPGREFQSDGPATEKVCGPSVLSWHRRATKRHRVLDRRCCHAETSDTVTQRSANRESFRISTVLSVFNTIRIIGVWQSKAGLDIVQYRHYALCRIAHMKGFSSRTVIQVTNNTLVCREWVNF